VEGNEMKKMEEKNYIELAGQIKTLLEILREMQCNYGLPKEFVRKHLEPAERQICLFRAEIYDRSRIQIRGREWDTLADNVFYGENFAPPQLKRGRAERHVGARK
jgi:hypothetical protein